MRGTKEETKQEPMTLDVFDALVMRAFCAAVNEVRDEFFDARDKLLLDVRDGSVPNNNDSFVYALTKVFKSRCDPPLHEYAVEALHDLYCPCGKRGYDERGPIKAALSALLVLVSRRLCEILPDGNLAKDVIFSVPFSDAPF